MDSFWIFMFFVSMLIPATMVGFGALFARKAPQRINSMYGYRTRRSMKTKESWRFAHRHIGKLWVHIGLFIALLSPVVMVFLRHEDQDRLGYFSLLVVVAQLILMLFPIYLTEKALKQKFDD